MKIATGVDHLVYGWVFFGVVVFLLFWVGSYFREDQLAPVALEKEQVSQPSPESSSQPGLLLRTILVICVAILWPLVSYLGSASFDASKKLSISAPIGSGAWQGGDASFWHWQPYNAVSVQQTRFFSRADQSVGLYIQHRGEQPEIGEVIGSSSRFLVDDNEFRIISQDKVLVNLSEASIEVDQVQIRGFGDTLLVWSWYRVGDLETSNDYLAKFGQAKSRMGFGRQGDYRIVLATPVSDSVQSSHEVLQEFVSHYAADLSPGSGEVSP